MTGDINPINNTYLLVPGFGGSRLWSSEVHNGEHMKWTRKWMDPSTIISPEKAGNELALTLCDDNAADQLLWCEKSPFYVEDLGGLRGISALSYLFDETVPNGMSVSSSLSYGARGEDTSTGTATRGRPLVAVPGTTVMAQWVSTLNNTHQNKVLGHPFDWRLPPWQINWSYTKTLIEEQSAPIVILAHSQGVVYWNYFLNKETTIAWRKKHIKLFVSLGGPFKGTAALESMLVNRSAHGDTMDMLAHSVLKNSVDFLATPFNATTVAPDFEDPHANEANARLDRSISSVHESARPAQKIGQDLQGTQQDMHLSAQRIENGANTLMQYFQTSPTVSETIRSFYTSLETGLDQLASPYVLLPRHYWETRDTVATTPLFNSPSIQALYMATQKQLTNPTTAISYLLEDPGIPTLCVFGQLEYAQSTPIVAGDEGSDRGLGDGTIDIDSASYCRQWGDSTALRIIGASHRDLLHNKVVTDAILAKINRVIASMIVSPSTAPIATSPGLTAELLAADVSIDSHPSMRSKTAPHHPNEWINNNTASTIWTVVCIIGFTTFMISSLNYLEIACGKSYLILCDLTKRATSGIVAALGGTMPPSDSPESTAKTHGFTKVDHPVTGIERTKEATLTSPLLGTQSDGHLCGHQWPLIGSSSPPVDPRPKMAQGSFSSTPHSRLTWYPPSDYVPPQPVMTPGRVVYHNNIEYVANGSVGGVSLQPRTQGGPHLYHQSSGSGTPIRWQQNQQMHDWLARQQPQHSALIPHDIANMEYHNYPRYGGSLSPMPEGLDRWQMDGALRPPYRPALPARVASVGFGGVPVTGEECLHREAFMEQCRLEQAEQRVNRLIVDDGSLSGRYSHGSPVNGTRIAKYESMIAEEGRPRRNQIPPKKLDLLGETEVLPTIPTYSQNGEAQTHRKQAVRLPPMLLGVKGEDTVKANNSPEHIVGRHTSSKSNKNYYSLEDLRILGTDYEDNRWATSHHTNNS